MGQNVLFNKEKDLVLVPEFNPEVLQIWRHWIIERNRIYVKKEIEKAKSPWTEDSILQSFRFTNVKRWQDRESRWLINNITDNNRVSYVDKIYNCILFRSWNKGNSFDIICGKGITVKDLLETPIEEFRNRIEAYEKDNPKYVWFTNAFNTGGIKQTWKYRGKPYSFNLKDRIEYDDPELNIPLRMIYMIRDCINQGLADKIKASKTAEEVFKVLKSIRGCANFLAYQIYVDLTYIKEFPFSEDEFVVAGPGCKKGENFLFNNKNGLSYEEALFYIRDNQEELLKPFDLNEEYAYLPPENRRLTVMDIENSMCELSKYCKAFYETGRPRNKYHYLN